VNSKKILNGTFVSPPRVVPLGEMRLSANAIEAAEKSAGRSLRSSAKQLRPLAEIVADLAE